MQTSLTRSQTHLAFRAQPCTSRQRRLAVRASTDKDVSNTWKRSAAALGAALFMASPLTGAAIARPSDFIQSKPGANKGQPTNEDKFPFNPSTSGNQARTDTEKQTNIYSNPRSFSTNSGLGDKTVKDSDPLPSPVDTAPDSQTTGS